MSDYDYIVLPMFAVIIYYSFGYVKRLSDNARTLACFAIVALGLLGRLVPAFKIGVPVLLTLAALDSVINHKRYREIPFLLVVIFYTLAMWRSIS